MATEITYKTGAFQFQPVYTREAHTNSAQKDETPQANSLDNQRRRASVSSSEKSPELHVQ